jgi:dihydroorotase
VFAEEGALDRFEAFASLNGPAFYQLPVNDETITLVRGEDDLPERLAVPGGDDVHVFRGKTAPGWRVEG